MECYKIKKTLVNNKVNCFINYQRRNIKYIKNLKADLSDCLEVIVNYNNGLHNYASHAIDLLNFFFGKISHVNSFHNFYNKNKKNDQSISFSGIIKNKINIKFNAFNNVKYDLLDLEFICKTKKITLQAGGALIKHEKPFSGLFFEGYSHLKLIKNYKNSSNGFKELYSNLYNYMLTRNNSSKMCTIDDAIYVVKVCETVVKSYNNRGKKITVD